MFKCHLLIKKILLEGKYVVTNYLPQRIVISLHLNNIYFPHIQHASVMFVRNKLNVLSFASFQELKESFNYGLFCPPENGKAGKFLDEERRLGDYPFSGPVGYLEVSHFTDRKEQKKLITVQFV